MFHLVLIKNLKIKIIQGNRKNNCRKKLIKWRKTNMRFSVIVPVYNIEDKIKKCLDSIEKQIYRDFEVLIIIDGSKDGSEAICNKFKNKDHRFKVIYKENGGLVSARKCGAKLAKGEYVVNIDGDDYVDDNYLLEINNIIEKKSPDMIACGFKEISNNIQKKYNNLSEGIYGKEEILKIKESIIYDKNQKGFKGGKLINTIWTKIIKRDIYQKCQLLVPDYITVGEDLILNVYIINEIKSLYIIENAFYNYVVYPSSMMHRSNINNFKHYLDVSRELMKIDYIYSNDIYVYTLQSFISEIRKLAKEEDSYFAFNKIVIENVEISELHELAKKAHIKKYNVEFFIKYFLVSKCSYLLMYIVCKNI